MFQGVDIIMTIIMKIIMEMISLGRGCQEKIKTIRQWNGAITYHKLLVHIWLVIWNFI